MDVAIEPAHVPAWGMSCVHHSALQWSRASACRLACSGASFGVGGGFAGAVPALALGLRVPMRRAIATSLVIATGISAVGFAEHLLAGSHVAWATSTLPFAIAAILTASAGAAIGARLPRRALAHGFALLLGAVAMYLLVSVVATGGPPHG